MPFTIEQFLDVFRLYNEAIYPLQWGLFIVAVAAVLMAFLKSPPADRNIAAILTILWGWMGIAYHLVFFTRINPLAYVFGGMCILQALLFLYHGVMKGRIQFAAGSDTAGITGAILIIFALIAYPLLGYLFGHVYPYSPTFGAPCPTTIFTFGLLLWNRPLLPLRLIAIPFVWSLIGFSAALELTIREDVSLFLAGLITCGVVAFRNRNLGIAA